MARRKAPAFGAWLVAERKRRGWTQVDAIKELEKLTSVRVTRNWLSQLEGGEAPSGDLRTAWERLYGEAPSENGSGEGAELTALVAELRENTKAIRELIGWLGPLAAAGIAQGVAQAEAEARAAGDRPPDSPLPPQP